MADWNSSFSSVFRSASCSWVRHASSVFAPPDMEEACLTQLQDALQATLENEEFQTAIADDVDVPFEYTDGEGLREAVDNVLGAPEELVELLRKAYADQ